MVKVVIGYDYETDRFDFDIGEIETTEGEGDLIKYLTSGQNMKVLMRVYANFIKAIPIEAKGRTNKLEITVTRK